MNDRSDYFKRYREEHRDKIKQYKKKYREKHREELNEKRRKYYANNPQHYRQYRTAYYTKNIKPRNDFISNLKKELEKQKELESIANLVEKVDNGY